MDSSNVMALFSALALGHSLFLSAYFWAPIKKKPNRFFLALLLASLAIRIIKSVLVILIPNSPFIVPAIGLVGLAMIGPSLFFYFKSFKNVLFKVSRTIAFHFVPAGLLMVSIPFLNDDQMFWAYAASVAHMFAYLLISAYYVIKNQEHYKSGEIKWLKLILVCISVIWITFLAQLLIETFITYLIVTMVASVAIYGMSLWALRKRKLFVESGGGLSQSNIALFSDIAQEVDSALRNERLYQDPSLTIKLLGEKLNHKEYLISQAINYHYKKSFPELLNELRIEHAMAMIESDDFENLSIEGIAYESGYNSISAFYRSFKKIMGITPAHYKKVVA